MNRAYPVLSFNGQVHGDHQYTGGVHGRAILIDADVAAHVGLWVNTQRK